MARRKIAAIGNECVACGTCLRVCPAGALSVPKGIRAKVDAGKCVGCGKCEQACPAGVIDMVEREGTGDA
jgi:ferredoxin